MSSTGSVYDDFLTFRAVFIQAVALTWKDKDFKIRFMENPKEAMKEYFDYEYPFHMDLKTWYEKDIENKYIWYPTGTGAWVGPNNKLELVLPPKPEDGQETIALAAYHKNHLSMWEEANNEAKGED